MTAQFDWFVGNIDRALATDTYDNDALMSGEAWRAFAASIDRLGEQIRRDDVPAAPVDVAAGYRHLMGLIGTGLIQALAPADPFAPTFGAISRTDIFKWGMDCPDAAYQMSAIRGDLDYRVSGNLGSVGYLSFQVNQGMATLGNIRNDELVADGDGKLELWLGPTEHSGNWLTTPAEVDNLICRQFFGDWDSEQRASLDIELVSAVPAEATTESLIATPERVARQLAALSGFLEANAKFWVDVEVLGQSARTNAFDAATAKADLAGAQENLNGWGDYSLGPDEALIIEVRPAEARYWSLHAGNFWWESLNYAVRHTSLNHHQAVLDEDGMFRAVLAHRDPGVPNWIDTLGHTKGPLMFRWVVADHAPDATTTVVAFDAIREHLPASTGTVTPKQRAETIARRRRAVQRRFGC